MQDLCGKESEGKDQTLGQKNYAMIATNLQAKIALRDKVFEKILSPKLALRIQ